MLFKLLSCSFIYLFICHFTAKRTRLKRKSRIGHQTPVPAKVLKVTGMSSVRRTKSKNFVSGKATTTKLSVPCPKQNGCARSSIDGWEWHRWSSNALPSDKARVRGVHVAQMHFMGSETSAPQSSNAKGLSARTNRVKLRNLLAAAEGAELLKVNQLKVIKVLFLLFVFLINVCTLIHFFIIYFFRQGKKDYDFRGARFMIGDLLLLNRLRQKIL